MKRTLFTALLLLPFSAIADSYVSSHSCRKPYKPYTLDKQYEVDAFKDEVTRYKRCISDFVDEQNREAKSHSDAASDAIDEWNRYVKLELN